MNSNHVAAITIRPLTETDRDAVLRLAQLDSGHAPEGDLLGVEVEGRLLAAISLSNGGAIADPFSRTRELQAMLELRAAQHRRRQRPGRSRLAFLRPARSRAALAGSPPGAGGRLLTIPLRP